MVDCCRRVDRIIERSGLMLGLCLFNQTTALVGVGQLTSPRRKNLLAKENVTAPTPPGWYPDPSGSGRQMYWDGHGWAAPQLPTATKKGSNGGKVVFIVVGISSSSSRWKNPEAVTIRLQARRQVQAGLFSRPRRCRPQSQRPRPLRRPHPPDRQCGTASSNSASSG